ncbi:cyclic nucleotide-binding domain-containing protein [Novosphingobium sp. P6W]|uniref:cyclic nucleotide-binding domain-containing protein n=1 Tax=Novosphingobium sp. P6W TaxID=1609758 RepID=UPI0005C5E0AF|nr:cyclic nucleotide-binding domain-containing protein [Novosphingobium sp. P6W]
MMMKRLTEFNGVGEEDLAFFRSLCEQERFVQRRQVIRAQSEPAQQIFLLCSGWAASCFDLRNGERQIVKVHLPGDVLERFPQRLNRERFPPRENSDSESLLGMEAGMDGQSIVAGFA